MEDMINPGMKIIQQFKTIIPGLADASVLKIPCQINYSQIKSLERYFTIQLNEIETIDIQFEKMDATHRFFSLINSSVFTEAELREMASLFEFDILDYPANPDIYGGVLKSSPTPRSILYANFYNHQNKDFCVIQQINGLYEYDSNYPLFWRVAEVELSEEFRQKLDFHWQNTLKTIHTTTT